MSDEVVFLDLIDALLTPDASQEKRTQHGGYEGPRKEGDDAETDGGERRGRGRRRSGRRGGGKNRAEGNLTGSDPQSGRGGPTRRDDNKGEAGDGEQRHRRRSRSGDQQSPTPKAD